MLHVSLLYITVQADHGWIGTQVFILCFGGVAHSSRRGLHLRRLQITLSAAKLGARVGAVHEKAHPDGICLCINRREDQGTWGLAREDARESARNHTPGR